MPPPDVVAIQNVTPIVIEEQRVVYKTYKPEEVSKWKPKDLIQALKTAGGDVDPKFGYAFVLSGQMEDLFAILSEKVFIWGSEDKMSFEEIYQIMHFASARPMGAGGSLLCETCALGLPDKVFDFLWKFLVFCEKDKRYYDLLGIVLFNRAKPDTLPLFIRLSRLMPDDFERLFARLPESIQEVLASQTYRRYDENEKIWYCFTLRESFIEYDPRDQKSARSFRKLFPYCSSVERIADEQISQVTTYRMN